LAEPGHAGRSYDVDGPRALSFAEALQIISCASGRRVVFRDTVEAYLAAQDTLGVPRITALRAVNSIDQLRRLGDDRPRDVVQQVTGRSPKTFESYAAQAAARGAWRR
jgi:uncharacterized protein YbjT (DUF2867 family)